MACNWFILTTVGKDAKGGDVPQVALDFVHEWGPGQATGETVHISRKRRDDTWIEGDLSVYELTVVKEGIRNWASKIYPPTGKTLDVCIIHARAVKGLKPDIHSSATSEVLAMWGNGGKKDPVTGYEKWLPGLPFTSTRWNRIRTFLLANGGTASRIDKWRTNHPDATPQDLVRAMRRGYIW